MLVSSIFMWTFLGASLALCTAFLNQYADGQLGILTLILGSSLLASFSLSGTLFVLARRFATSSLLARMTLGSYPLSSIHESFDAIARDMGVRASLHEASVGNAFSVSVHGDNVVALSTDIARSLSSEETEAVLAHELSHIKNRDSRAKGLARVAHFAFPFDPAIRVLEAAVHRERELLADRVSSKFTRKPLALASALLKACSAAPSEGPRLGTGLCVGGTRKGLLSLYPDLEERIEVLVELSKRLGLKEALLVPG